MKTSQRNKFIKPVMMGLGAAFCIAAAPLGFAQTDGAERADEAKAKPKPTSLVQLLSGGDGALSKAADAVLAERYKTSPEFRIARFDEARAHHHSGDGREAIRIFTQLAVHAQHTPSMRWLGRMAFEGEAQETNKALAYEWFLKAATAGDADAMLQTAGLSLSGAGTTQSDRAARHWLLYAADRGSSDADAMLLRMFDKGLGGPADKKMAMVFAKRQAKSFKPDGLYYMGLAYRDGDGVTQDLEEARRMLEAAQEYGHEDAEAALAVMDYESNGETP